CPPRPEMLLNALLELHKQIREFKFGVDRVAAARAAEEAAMRAVPTHQQKGLLACAGRPPPPVRRPRTRTLRPRRPRTTRSTTRRRPTSSSSTPATSG